MVPHVSRIIWLGGALIRSHVIDLSMLAILHVLLPISSMNSIFTHIYNWVFLFAFVRFYVLPISSFLHLDIITGRQFAGKLK